MNAVINILKKIDTGIEKFSTCGLTVSIILMLGLTIFSIVLRWFESSMLWIDPFVRHLVFLSAFLGGVIATGRKNHIGIDVLSRFLEAKKSHTALLNLQRLISLVATCGLVWLTISAINFVKIELQYGKPDFLGIHSGILVAIIPFGFALIGYRFMYLFFETFADKSSSQLPAESEITKTIEIDIKKHTEGNQE